MTQSPPSASTPPPEADFVTDEVTAAKVALLRTAYEPKPGAQTPSLIRQHPVAAAAVAFAGGALIGGLPIARKLLFVVAGFAGKNVLMRFLRGK